MNTAMRIEDLKVGYIVKLRNGDTGIVSETTKGPYIVTLDGRAFIAAIYNYSTNLTHKFGDEFDIMEVYGYAVTGPIYETYNRALIYDRSVAIDEVSVEDFTEIVISALSAAQNTDALESLEVVISNVVRNTETKLRLLTRIEEEILSLI